MVFERNIRLLNESVVNLVHQPFGAEQEMYAGFIRDFLLKTAASDISGNCEPNL